MATMPREPRSRIVLAVILTAAIGGMFLAGDRPHPDGAPVASAPVDQRAVQQGAPPVAAPPSADEILTFTGRDPFARDQKEKKTPQRPNPGTQPALSVPAADGTSASAGGGVAVSAGGLASSGSGSTRTSPTAGGGQIPEPKTVSDTTPDTVVSTSLDPVPVEDEDGSDSSEESAGSSDTGKPAKPESPRASKFEAFQRTKEKPVQSRGLHRGWSQAPRRKPGYTASGWRGKGNAWGWRTKCKAHPHSQAGCRR